MRNLLNDDWGHASNDAFKQMNDYEYLNGDECFIRRINDTYLNLNKLK